MLFENEDNCEGSVVSLTFWRSYIEESMNKSDVSHLYKCVSVHEFDVKDLWYAPRLLWKDEKAIGAMGDLNEHSYGCDRKRDGLISKKKIIHPVSLLAVLVWMSDADRIHQTCERPL